MLQYETYPLTHSISVQAIVSADYLLEPVWDEENHTHTDAWELCCCLQGTLEVQRSSIPQPLRGGEVLFLPPGTDHLVGMRQPASTAFVISFTCNGDNHLRPLQNTVIPVSGPLLLSLQSIREELEMCFLPEEASLHLMHFRPNDRSPFGAEQMISTYLEQFLIRLLRSVTMSQGQIVSSGDFREAMHRYLAQQVVFYIQDHINEPLTVEQIAAHFHYSRAHLTAVCKQATALGIHELITREKLHAAKLLLRQQEKTVAQISRELGFSTPHYFSWKFKQLVGCAPSCYIEYLQTNKTAED